MTGEISLGQTPMRLRRATIEDARMLLRWRNDAETRKQSISTEPVPWENHVQWLQKSLENPRRILAIAETLSEEPIGTIRADTRDDGFTEISYTVAPAWRGKGVSKPMAQEFVRKFLQGKRIAASIKKGHGPSESVARALGLAPFLETPSENPEDPRPLVEWR